jgi:hypothetical protein
MAAAYATPKLLVHRRVHSRPAGCGEQDDIRKASQLNTWAKAYCAHNVLHAKHNRWHHISAANLCRIIIIILPIQV